ncbi:hypothetical protein EDC18_11066 [Natranaerovirga pectinivora]|uniref:Phosphatidylglycerol lysyltransferase n=1 Tax=Natranaerovirga pectinivora TaxID=682400 RepID=A0A4R3MKP1_9FIRM|nr:lysylphosphatidylglycerol synthase transmembrane domain-containing protein [Natranaerovirga pectinivora]TCT12992.1 hypothetical protein EDC18_11066 [Natranaerovirga pectinivora]
MKKMKKRMLSIIGIILVSSLLFLSDLEVVWQTILGIGIKHIIILCLMQIVTIFLLNLQWYTISKRLNVIISFKDIFDINMTGTFVECITPAVKAGGELTKVIMFSSKFGISKGCSSAIVGIQKIVSLTSFVLLNFISLFLFLTVYNANVNISIILLSLIFIIVMSGSLFILVFKNNKVESLICKLPFVKNKEKVIGFFTQFRESIRTIKKRNSFFMTQFILSMIIWMFFAIKAFYIIRMINLDVSFIVVSMITYITYMIGMLPLLPGGLGTFEGSLIMLLTPFGASLDQGITVALVLRFVTFWFVFLLSGAYLGSKALLKKRIKGKLQCN